MGNLSDKRQETIVIPGNQSFLRAGDRKFVYDDASAWATTDGIKQNRGYAYLDGSTVSNSSGDYDALWNALGQPGTQASFDLPAEGNEQSDGQTYTRYAVISLFDNVATNVLSLAGSTETIDLSSDANAGHFDSGIITLKKDYLGVVSMFADGPLGIGTPATSARDSLAGLIPVGYRPANDAYNVYVHVGDVVYLVGVFPDGMLRFFGRDMSDQTIPADVTTIVAPTLTYHV